MSGDFPAELQRFLHDNFSSVEQLEVMFLLRAHRDKDWGADEVSRVIYSTPSAVQMRLDELLARGLIRPGTLPRSFRYDPSDQEKDRLCGQLEEMYRERRVAVITLIYSKQSTQVQAFADAFRLRKD